MKMLPTRSPQAAALSRSAFVQFAKHRASAVFLALVALLPASAWATTYDANSLTIASSSGDTVITSTNSGANNGDMRIYLANAVSDYIGYQVNVPSAGTYSVAVRYHKNPNRGTIQLAIGGVDQGGAIDLYDPAGAFEEFALGTVTLSAGTSEFKFTSTGHNASSTSYRVALDTITLNPAATRTDITTFATIEDALASNVPLYAPPGTYTLPSNYTPTAPIDIIGNLDPAQQPVFKVNGSAFLAPSYAMRYQGIKFESATTGNVNRLIFSPIGAPAFDMPSYTILDCTFTKVTPMHWSNGGGPTAARSDQTIHYLEMRRFTVTDAARGVHIEGRVDNFDITDFTIQRCGTYGLEIGPSGKNAMDVKIHMQGGYVGHGLIENTKIENSYSNSQLVLSGQNIIVEDMELNHMVLLPEYYTDPNYATKYPPNAEPFYTKVIGLTVNNLRVRNDGAYQAMWGNKGASADGSNIIFGSDSYASDCEFWNVYVDANGVEQPSLRVAAIIWNQCNGTNVFERITAHFRTRDALIEDHSNNQGCNISIVDWIDESKNVMPGNEDLKFKTIPTSAVTITNCPSLTDVVFINP